MKAFTGWTISAGLALAALVATATAAAAQDAGRAGYVAASDFGAPYADAPPLLPRGPAYGPPPAYGPAPSDFAPVYGAPLLPPTEIYAVLRENGFSPLGVPRLRGLFYSIVAIDRRGDDGRLVIDARDGRIVRFLPAYRLGGYGDARDGYYGGPAGPSYGPVEPMTRLDGPPRPQASVPKIASRMPQSVPVPKAAPLRSGDERPIAEKAAPAPSREPMQQSAAVQAKPSAAPQAASAPTAASAEARPAAPVIQPTQQMPQVQGLE